MKTTWRLTALEFLVAWEHLGLDRLPSPLSFLGTAETTDEFDAQKVDAARTLLGKGDDNLHRALTVLADPISEVVACGVDQGATEKMVRVRAGVDSRVGAVAEQLPGPTRDAGSDIRVSLCRRTEVGKVLADALPEVPAGRTKGITVHRSDLEQRDSGAVMRSAGYVSPRAEAVKFFDRPRLMFGEIMVKAGGRQADRPSVASDVLQWIDFADDGRYTIRNANTIEAVSASSAVVASEVQRMLARVEPGLAGS